ncbi:zinc metallopeptidase [Halanaerobium praevalens]|uniref:Peptidase membrane zinc metallopeptidase n=1 Tax=Halanaerobium praevalens (strain ATCC 33744 / DSM 2228 / GSL) TaxID=572479 RepID=E3DQS8_HALPG|nr:zinc metallopeptidase [Halanaerobium praevalens]ADO76903.1 peptidase membrane zinc metallopeptidase [Halanaerobium praevalens DSM 2228]
MFPFFFDPTMIVILPALLIAVYAQYKVKNTFKKYNQINLNSNLTGAEAARKILLSNNLSNIEIRQTDGKLSDHYDPEKKTLNLSADVYHNNSVAAVGVAAHEVGHAIQDKENYKPLSLRASLVPAANIGSSLGLPLAIFGFFIRADFLIMTGFVLFSAAFLFHLVTLPVEFNASNRAISNLKNSNLLNQEELKGVKKVLKAAAFTYVATTLVALANMLRILLLAGLGDD